MEKVKRYDPQIAYRVLGAPREYIDMVEKPDGRYVDANILSLTRELAEALEEFGSHKLPCLLAQWRQGRPTNDGGYETQYGDKWYRGDDKPPCTCGFDAALSKAREAGVEI